MKLNHLNSKGLNLTLTDFLRVVQTQAILCLKSMSIKVGSDTEQLLI